MCAVVLTAGSLWAQNVTVTGTVVDNNNEPVIGAYVVVEGTTVGTSTDANGAYRISAPRNGNLTFSSIGYKTQTVSIEGRSLINIILADDAEMLQETVVTALGIKKERKALGYSVTEVKSEELLRNKQTNVINSLAGKVPGVNVTQAGGAAGAGSSIIIRGGNSASEGRDNQPLFVVDGIIYDNSTVNAGNSGTDGMTKTATTFSNRVMDINPEDIESMSVLKGAAAAALYGSRAADGVVVITTKKGAADGNVKVNFSTKYSYATISSAPEIQNTYARGSYDANGMLQTDQVFSSWGEKVKGRTYDNVADFFKGANVFDNSVSVSGGHKNGSFFLSASNFDQNGVVPGTSYIKNTVRFNGEQKYGKLTVGANVAYSIADTKKTLTTSGLYDGGGNGTMTALYSWPRSENMSHWMNDDGTKYRMFPNVDPSEEIENPYWIINKNELTDKNKRITGAVTASLDLTSWLNVAYRMGIDSYNNDSYTYIAPGGNVKSIYQNGRLSKAGVAYDYWTSNLMLNAHKQLGDFDFNLLAGTTAESTTRVRNTRWGWDFVTAGTISFGNIIDENKKFTESTTRKRLVGVYGEFRTAYKNIAYLTVTGRNDWSSTLPVENNSYFYPSVSGSFVFTELMPKNNFLTFGKLRASWARVGKDAGAYATNTYLWDAQVVNGNFIGIGNSWTGGSPYLVPEIQTSWEVGTELKFFGGRLGIDYTYYNSITRNQIAAPRLAQSTGYIFLTINSGSVQNKGMELMITGTPVDTRNFTWDVTLNLSGNRGTLGDFVDGVDFFYVTDVQIGGVKAASIPNGGYFLGLTGNYWVRETEAVQDLDKEGNVQYNADGSVKMKQVEKEGGRYEIDPSTGLYKLKGSTTNVVGNREPIMIGGLNNNLRWKNLSLSFLLDLRLGGDIYNGTQYFLTSYGQSMRTLQRDKISFTGVVNTGTAANPVWEDKTVTYEAGQTYEINGRNYSGASMIQSYYSNYCNNAYNFIEKVNWVRLRAVNLSYDFSSLLKGQNFIKGLVATASANNLFVWTNYTGGLDPEVAATGSGTGGSGSVGIDYCGVPSQRMYSFGLNLTF
ncbi:MAG: SusC/RagA family TonB-linked outer membrane protein [Bacteroidales bacterium]|nr:SusC/RagA family TonB-linked outer membrane protein [Bacteroidales bacterium]